MTWKDFQIILMAHERKEVGEWRKVRSVVYMQYAMNTIDKVKKTPEQFMPLPGDLREKVIKVDQKDLVKRIQMLYGNRDTQA